jgi:membrane fusion protein (multidrug efflux system)
MSEHAAHPAGRPRGGRRHPGRAKMVVVALLSILLLAWGGRWLYYRYTHVHVEDARIDGEIVTVSSRVSGWVTELPVIEGETVAKGQLLARIDDRDTRMQRDVLLARLSSLESQSMVVRAQSGQVDEETLGRFQSETNRLVAAEAEVAVSEVQMKQARDDFRRAEDLTAQKWLSQQAMERSRSAFLQAQEHHRKALAEVAAVRGNLSTAGGSRRQLQVLERQMLVFARQADEIRAEIRRLETDIADRVIASPADGVVVMTFVRKGEHVATGQRMLMFHDPRQIWVEANVKETDVGKLSAGMPVRVRVDAYRGREFAGEIFRIGQAATSKFALLPDPNPSGNFTKITQRLPVRILLKEADPRLRPGMMVEVDIAVRND